MFGRRRQGIPSRRKLESAKEIKLKTFFLKFFRIQKRVLKYWKHFCLPFKVRNMPKKSEEGSGCSKKKLRWFEGGWNFFTFTASQCPPRERNVHKTFSPLNGKAGKSYRCRWLLKLLSSWNFTKCLIGKIFPPLSALLFSQIHSDGDDGM